MQCRATIKIPKFERYKIITSESLNMLSFNLTDYVKAKYENSSEGVITGLNISYSEEENNIRLNKGIFKIKDKIFWLNTEINLEMPKEEGRYYFIAKNTESFDNSYYIDDIEFKFIKYEDYQDEFVIFSVILRDNAKICPINSIFDEYREEFNTISLIDQKFSIPNSKYHSLSSELLKRWAYELSKKTNLKQEDINFMFFCLNGIVSRELIVSYLNIKFNKVFSLDITNSEILKKLANILNKKEEDIKKEEMKTNEEFYIQ